MSLYGALFSGVSGLQSQSSAMGAIADNVTNVNTIGYKGTQVNFQTLVTKQVSLTKYSAGGVQSKPRAGIDVQGLLQATSSSTDVGISGQGFFIVNEASEPGSGDLYAYTRAGSYKVDKDGYLANVGGYYLQGWPMQTWDNTSSASQITEGTDTYMKAYTNANGETVYINDNIVDSTNLRPLNLSTIGGTAENTTTVSLGANLPADDDVGDTHKTNTLIYDSLGNNHNILYQWAKRATNSWDLYATPPADSASITLESPETGNPVYYSAGRMDFTGNIPADGSSFTIQAGGVTYTINFSATAGTDDAVFDSGAGTPDVTGTVSTNGRTLSQVLDQLADTVNAALTDVFTTVGGTAVPDPPGAWAERVSGEQAIIFRQGDTTAMTVDPSNLQDSSGDVVVQQWSATDTTFSVAALDATIGWVGATDYAMTFNGDGTPDTLFGADETSIDDPRMKVSIDWYNGANDMDDGTGANADPKISMFMGNFNIADGVTQSSGSYQINYLSQNGAKFGNFASVSIGSDGIVTALFDNGVTRPIFMIPIATFVNANGMEALTGNVWIETDFSGQPTVREAGEAGAGSVNQGTLESSTVDLGEEFTTMITTQRAYSAAAKIITTSDEMLDELVRIKR